VVSFDGDLQDSGDKLRSGEAMERDRESERAAEY
jgi:hypothetical protein